MELKEENMMETETGKKKPFCEALKAAIQKAGKQIVGLADEIKAGKGTVYNWTSGRSFPSLENLRRIDERLGTDFLSEYGETSQAWSARNKSCDVFFKRKPEAAIAPAPETAACGFSPAAESGERPAEMILEALSKLAECLLAVTKLYAIK